LLWHECEGNVAAQSAEFDKRLNSWQETNVFQVQLNTVVDLFAAFVGIKLQLAWRWLKL
jgi:hypothetical protein